MKVPPKLIGWPIAAAVLLFRWTCRPRLHGDDPRPDLRDRGEKYVYAILHAHQVAITAQSERGTAAMVSRSNDGELMIPAFRVMGVTPKRGSSRRGGADALEELVEHVDRGDGPALIAVDGPRGPRGRVRKGIASLAKRTGAVVVCVVAIPRWRLVMRGTWDRFQTPLPLSRIDGYFAAPIRPLEGESVEGLRRRIEQTLRELDERHDPAEAAANAA